MMHLTLEGIEKGLLLREGDYLVYKDTVIKRGREKNMRQINMELKGVRKLWKFVGNVWKKGVKVR
jgi:hypothetical protein